MPQDQTGSAVLTVFESVLLARKQVSGWRLQTDDLVEVNRTLTALDIGELANDILSELSGASSSAWPNVSCANRRCCFSTSQRARL